MHDGAQDGATGAGAKRWLSAYPEGVPAEVDPSVYPSLLELFEERFQKFSERGFLTLMGKTLSYADVERLSKEMAAYFQTLGLEKGDRIAVMAPNVFQQPIAVLAVLRAGYVVVNVNPLYTARELRHQLIDSGAKAIVILENFAATLQEIIADTEIEHIVVTALGDQLGGLKGMLVNTVVRHVKKMVPRYSLPGAVKFNDAMKIGKRSTYSRPQMAAGDLAILQYTGGTTGVAKGAMLLHQTLVSALLSSSEWCGAGLRRNNLQDGAVAVCALPLYHVFALVNVHLMSILNGGRLILIPNPRDLPALIKALKGERFNLFPGVNTLFTALAKHPDFAKLDFSGLVVALGGGAAVLEGTAEAFRKVTGRTICQGYGLSETSSGICCMPTDEIEYTGSIGVPLPSVEIRILDDAGAELAVGERGEICIRGGPVMAGYWNRPEATAEAFTSDGFFRSGDIGVMDEQGYVRIVDRKKDMILVSGFNVYPNEVEDVISTMEGVTECAAIGVPDENTGEAIRIYVVREGDVDAEAIKAFCRENMVGYKCPKQIVFTEELPKSLIGKILRRELREKAMAEAEG